MPKRIVISGYYGFGNTGDEAVLAGMLAGFRKAGLGARVTVLSADPLRTTRENPGIDAVDRSRLLSVIRAILSADIVVSGGGSLFQDVTSAASPYYYLAILWLARLLGRRTMIYAQGVGPLERKRARKAVAKAFNRASSITVRDPDSKTLLESIGVTRPAICVVADPAFLLDSDLQAADSVLAKHGLAGGEFIGVCLRQWPGHQGWQAAVCDGVEQAARELGVRVAMIPMQEPEDLACADVAGAVVLSGAGGPRVVKGLISRCGLVVGMRLHSLIFAASESTPFLPVVYDPKVESFARAAGVENGLRLESVKPEGVKEAVIQAWRSRANTRLRLADKAGEWRNLALKSAEMLGELIQQ